MTEVLKSAIGAFEAEYKDRIELWKQLELKAQGLAVIDGVLLTGSITFATRVSSGSPTDHQYLFGLLLASLLVSVGVAIRTLRIDKVAAPPYGHAYWTLASDLVDLSREEFESREANWYRDQIRLWTSITLDLDAKIRKKAKWLLCGQYAMFVSLFLLLVILSTVIYRM